MAARCRATARRWRRCPGSGARPPTSCSTWRSSEPTIAVDTHIFRVGNRTGIAPGKTPHAVETGLEAVTPPQYRLNAHHWLILHGRHVCKARKPECRVCVVADLCRYGAKTMPEEAIAPPKAKSRRVGG